jgi:ADP-ribose pyrophosphatase YjhB (NUDIX family)
VDSQLRRIIHRWKLVNSDISAVGVWFYCSTTDRFLYLMRNDSKHPYHWGLPGGKCECDESLLDTITRECAEEMGAMPEYIKLVPIECFKGGGDHFAYHTFFCLVTEEFIPKLNDEHLGYAWLDAGTIPKPLHPGLWNTVNIDDVYSKIDTVKELYLRSH